MHGSITHGVIDWVRGHPEWMKISPTLCDSSEVVLVCDPDPGLIPKMFEGRCGNFLAGLLNKKFVHDAGKISGKKIPRQIFNFLKTFCEQKKFP
ncbi:MAG: hypothetical protein WCX22_02220 [Methanoregula sp.]